MAYKKAGIAFRDNGVSRKKYTRWHDRGIIAATAPRSTPTVLEGTYTIPRGPMRGKHAPIQGRVSLGPIQARGTSWNARMRGENRMRSLVADKMLTLKERLARAQQRFYKLPG